MRLLAFDTSTDRMTVALTGPAPGQPWQCASAGGAAASASLIATVRALLDQANLRLQDLDAICFGSGPGSFTGLRTACAVAQGLALGADLLVLPVPKGPAGARVSAAAMQLQQLQRYFFLQKPHCLNLPFYLMDYSDRLKILPRR